MSAAVSENRMLHIITGLQTGGAELMLASLLAELGDGAYDPMVISLTGRGPVAERIERLGVPVAALNLSLGAVDPRSAAQLVKMIRRERPRVIQTWLYHANLIGGLAARAAGGPPVAWGLHQSAPSPVFNKRTTILTAQAGARLSRRLPASIVCCAEATLEDHAAIGYDRERMVVIPNGFDLDRYRPDPEAYRSVRDELGIARETPLIGLVARLDPQKDHETFVRMAGRIAHQRPDVHFLLCGNGVADDNITLVGWLREAGVRKQSHLLGRRDDVPRLQAALDLGCLSSQGGEAFPLAVGEAMACGVPCVVTDVGDSALLVGETGRAAPVRDPEALASAWMELLSLDPDARQRLSEAARERIATHYALPVIAKRYLDLYQQLDPKVTPCAA